MSQTGQHCHHHHPAAKRPALKDRPGEQALYDALLASMAHGDQALEELALGGRFVAARASGRVGLASTLGAQPAPGDAEILAGYKGQPLEQCAKLLLTDNPFLASVGLAALNAAFDEPRQAAASGAEDWLSGLVKGKRVVVAGDFPFANRLAPLASELTVLELDAQVSAAPPTEWARILSSCQVAAITSTALLTRALASLLNAAPQALRLAVGPSTPLSPALFQHGCQVLAGSWVEKPGPVMEAVEQGLPFKLIKKHGVRQIMWAQPGLDMERFVND